MNFIDTPQAGSSGSDEKVKAAAGDPTAGYLDAKVDDATIEIASNKIQIKEGGVDSTEIADLAVIEDKIAAGAVTNLKINADSDAIDNASTVAGATVTAALDANKTVADQGVSDAGDVAADLATHEADLANPHVVTKTQIGLSNVPNTDFTTPVADNTTHRGLVTGNPHNVVVGDLTIGTDDVVNKSSVAGITTSDALETLEAKDGTQDIAIGLNDTHRAVVAGNPHIVTKAEVGLSNVPNTDFTTPVADNTTHSSSDGSDHSLVNTNSAHVADITTNPHSVTAAQTGALENVVEDLTPQLGGNLDTNGKEITTISNLPIILNANGTGSIQVDSGGNARGNYAIDLQKDRNNDTQVASGLNSFVAGGRNNTASGSYSHAEGYDNTASGNYSHAGGIGTLASGNGSSTSGFETTASGEYSSASGYGSTASGDYGSSASGYRTTASGDSSSTSGYNTTASGHYSHAEGTGTTASGRSSHAEGSRTTASGDYSSTSGRDTIAAASDSYAGGAHSKASRYSEFARSAWRFSATGDAQKMENYQMKETSDATQTELTIIGGTPDAGSRLILPAETTWMFTIQLSAYNDTDNLAAGYFYKGVIRRNAAGDTSIIGTVAEDIWEEGAMSACSVVVQADNTNNSLQTLVTGIAAKNIRWHSVINISQVSYGTP